MNFQEDWSLRALRLADPSRFRAPISAIVRMFLPPLMTSGAVQRCNPSYENKWIRSAKRVLTRAEKATDTTAQLPGRLPLTIAVPGQMMHASYNGYLDEWARRKPNADMIPARMWWDDDRIAMVSVELSEARMRREVATQLRARDRAYFINTVLLKWGRTVLGRGNPQAVHVTGDQDCIDSDERGRCIRMNEAFSDSSSQQCERPASLVRDCWREGGNCMNLSIRTEESLSVLKQVHGTVIPAPIWWISWAMRIVPAWSRRRSQEAYCGGGGCVERSCQQHAIRAAIASIQASEKPAGRPIGARGAVSGVRARVPGTKLDPPHRTSADESTDRRATADPEHTPTSTPTAELTIASIGHPFAAAYLRPLLGWQRSSLWPRGVFVTRPRRARARSRVQRPP
ncbi:hypothetical protein PSPO01_11388 [Paraphaeosphaeria sporulosa]